MKFRMQDMVQQYDPRGINPFFKNWEKGQDQQDTVINDVSRVSNFTFVNKVR